MKRILSLCFVFLMLCGIARSQDAWMPDANLCQAVREALQLPDDAPLTQVILSGLIGLEASDRQIRDLTGLELATHATWFTLGGNLISDLSPLRELTQTDCLFVSSTTDG